MDTSLSHEFEFADKVEDLVGHRGSMDVTDFNERILEAVDDLLKARMEARRAKTRAALA